MSYCGIESTAATAYLPAGHEQHALPSTGPCRALLTMLQSSGQQECCMPLARAVTSIRSMFSIFCMAPTSHFAFTDEVAAMQAMRSGRYCKFGYSSGAFHIGQPGVVSTLTSIVCGRLNLIFRRLQMNKAFTIHPAGSMSALQVRVCSTSVLTTYQAYCSAESRNAVSFACDWLHDM